MNKVLQRGFTLIELMIVVSIICILASIAVPSFVKYRETSITAKCITNLRCIQDAREAYFLDHPSETEVKSNDSDFVVYLGAGLSVVENNHNAYVTERDRTACPYNMSPYSMGCPITSITLMPTCPNAASAPCTAHVYSAR